jgi:serine/threonine protein kinase
MVLPAERSGPDEPFTHPASGGDATGDSYFEVLATKPQPEPAVSPPRDPPTGAEPPTVAEQDRDDTGEEGRDVPAYEPGPANFGRFERLEKVAEGGMGVVYRARDVDLGRDVALKTVRTDGARASENLHNRFLLEARALAQLRHPNIIPVYAFGTFEGKLFFAMEFLSGGSLAQQVERFSEGDPTAVVSLMEKVARAVQFAHSRQILHRDLKPGNILLSESGEPFVSDFGLAKSFDSPQEPIHPNEAVPGTPAYMSPEQSGGRADVVGAATDTWALGVVLFQLLTGQLPFNGNRNETLDAIRTTAPPAPRTLRPGLDRSLEAIVLRCLKKDPKERYPSTGALADDLKRWRLGEPTVARPDRWPARIWRAVRRHPAVSTAVGLTVAFVTATVFASGSPNGRPDDEPPVAALQSVESELAAGRPASLLDGNGGLRWFHRQAGKTLLGRHPVDADTAWLQSFERGLTELLPAPPDSGYRLEAELRLEQVLKLGEAGVYFAHTVRDTPFGIEHWCGTLTVGADEAARCDWVQFQWQRYREAGVGPSNGATKLFTARLPLPWKGTGGLDWHRLTVEVTPGRLALFCDQILVGNEVKEEDVPQMTRSLAWLEPKFADGFIGNSSLRGGVGVYASGVSVSLRKVSVTPLSP